MKKWLGIDDILLVIGGMLVITGFCFIYYPVALIVAGSALFYFGYKGSIKGK